MLSTGRTDLVKVGDNVDIAAIHAASFTCDHITIVQK